MERRGNTLSSMDKRSDYAYLKDYYRECVAHLLKIGLELYSHKFDRIALETNTIFRFKSSYRVKELLKHPITEKLLSELKGRYYQYTILGNFTNPDSLSYTETKKIEEADMIVIDFINSEKTNQNPLNYKEGFVDLAVLLFDAEEYDIIQKRLI